MVGLRDIPKKNRTWLLIKVEQRRGFKAIFEALNLGYQMHAYVRIERRGADLGWASECSFRYTWSLKGVEMLTDCWQCGAGIWEVSDMLNCNVAGRGLKKLYMSNIVMKCSPWQLSKEMGLSQCCHMSNFPVGLAMGQSDSLLKSLCAYTHDLLLLSPFFYNDSLPLEYGWT